MKRRYICVITVILFLKSCLYLTPFEACDNSNLRSVVRNHQHSNCTPRTLHTYIYNNQREKEKAFSINIFSFLLTFVDLMMT